MTPSLLYNHISFQLFAKHFCYSWNHMLIQLTLNKLQCFILKYFQIGRYYLNSNKNIFSFQWEIIKLRNAEGPIYSKFL